MTPWPFCAAKPAATPTTGAVGSGRGALHRSEAFRARWGAHNVRLHRTGRKQLHHPVAGDLELTYEALELPGDPGLTIITYTAEPDSASQDALAFLASWAATPDQLGQPETAQAPDEA